ncbi:MAG: ERF superfamily protein [Namikivirus tsukuho]|uniref:ERF superfamily protein n=1 Tax=Bacteriophage sp. TaxID=38018 RepID=A0ABY5TRL6_9VIRU|nr:MAG: ERF superfamily protein [Bacteriophage sp.]
MENNTLSKKFMQVLNEVPNFSTDETANAGSRTYKYLNLSTLLKNIKPIFEKHGIAFSQKVTFDGTGGGRQALGTVETIIFDENEQQTVCEYPFFVTGDPQQVGSAITYARRYSLTTVLGIFPDKDDDGGYAKQRYDTADRPIGADQYATLVKAMDAHRLPSEARGEFISGTLNRPIKGWRGITQADLTKLMGAINKM